MARQNLELAFGGLGQTVERRLFFVGGAHVVGQVRTLARRQHLHHERSAGAEAPYDGDVIPAHGVRQLIDARLGQSLRHNTFGDVAVFVCSFH